MTATRGSEGFNGPIPEKSSTLISRLVFAWMDPLFHAGYNNNLTEKTVWLTPKHEYSDVRVKQLEAYYEEELKRKKNLCCCCLLKDRPLLRALIRLRLWEWILCSCLKFFGELLAFSQPIILSLLLDFIEVKYKNPDDTQAKDMLYPLFLVFLMDILFEI